MGENDCYQFMRLRSQPVLAAEKFDKHENLSCVLIPTISKDMNEQLKLAHKVVDKVDRANGKICVTPLRDSVDKPQSSQAQVRMFSREKEDKKFQQIV